MSDFLLSLITVALSLLGAVAVCGLTFGRLQGKVEASTVRLNRIESEHTGVVQGLAAVQATVQAINQNLAHINDHLDRVACKEDVARLGARIDVLLAKKGD